MANNTVKIDLQVASQGMDPAVQKSQTIKDNLTAAAGAMTRAGGGTAGSRAISQKTEGQEYAAQRGVAGATGASARNFAAESQGLGGLVRLYATFAANTYAAAAAFKALSDAMDTSNMVKGLDQLGAASGRGLGSLAKSLVTTTGNALSLREAMDATAKSSAAGLTSDQILRMGTAATKASQALGINLPDAMSRLSRGISKLEPELLDELGIYTKLEQSTNDYARSIGKSATQLTDFERRQAFANAVLTEAEQKFGKIKLDANPYDQLAASFKNLAQTGLELVNTVLAPVVKLLASSPTALITVLGGIGALLLKQAIPAIGQYKEALQAAANQSLLAVSQKTTASGQQLAQKIASVRQEAEALAEVQVTARDAAIEKYEKLKGGGFAKEKAKVGKIFDAAVLDVPKESLDYLDTMSRKNLANNKKLSDSYKEIADTIRAGQAAERNYIAIREKELLLESELAATAKSRQLADADFRRLSATALSKEITAKTVASVKELGLVASLTQAWDRYQKARSGPTTLEVPTGKMTTDILGNAVPELEKIVAPQITRGAGLFGMLRTGIMAAGTALIDLIGKFALWGIALDAVISAGSFVLDWFSTTKEQAKTTAAALETLATANTTVVKTLDDINSRPLLQQFTVASVVARTTALGELTSALTKTYKAASEQMSLMSPVDLAVDWVKGLVGKGVQQKTGSEFAKALQNAQKAAISTPESNTLFSSIEKSLGVSIQDTKGLEKAFLSLGGTSSEQVKLIVNEVDALGKSQRTAIAVTEDLKSSWAEGYKSLTAFLTSALPQDALSKLAQNQIADAEKLKTALENPVSSLVTMKELANDINALKLFPPAAAQNIAKYAQELNEMSSSADRAAANLVDISEEVVKLSERKNIIEKGMAQTKFSPSETVGVKTQAPEELKLINEQLDNLKNKEKINIKITAELETKRTEIKKVFEDGLRDQFIAGAGILSAKIAESWAKVNTTFSNAVANAMGDSYAANKIRADNEKLVIRGQAAGIKSQMDLIIAVNRNSDQLELSTTIALRQEAAIKASQGDALGSKAAETAQTEYEKLIAREKRLTEKLAAGGTVKQQVGPGSAALTKDLKAGVLGVTAADVTFTQSLESLLAQLAQLGAQGKTIDFNKVITDLKTAYNYQTQGLDVQTKTVQERLREFDVITASGQALNESQLIEKEGLENASAALASAREIANIDADIAQKRLVIANTTDATARLEITNQVVKLENTDKQLVLDRLGNTLAINRAKTEASIRDIAKETLDVKARTADVITTSAAQSKINELDIDKDRLNVLKATNRITENTYLTEKAAQDRRAEDLNKENTLYALKKDYTQKLAQLNENIRKYEKDVGLKEQYEAEKRAEEDAYNLRVSNVTSLTDAKKRGIDEVAEYEKSKALTEGVTDSIVTALTEGGKIGGKKLRKVLADELKKPFSTIIQAIVQPITSALASIGSSMISSAIGGAAGGAGSSMLASGLAGAAGAAGLGSLGAAASSFGSGLSAGFAGTGAVFTSPAAAAAAAGEVYTGATLASTAGSAGATAGSMLSSLAAAGPYLLAAGAVLNALGVFRTTKVKDQGITGTLGVGGSIESYQTMRKSGTLFQGPDYWVEKQSFALSEAIQSAFKDNRTATASLAESLNLNSGAVQNFTTTLGKDTYRGVTGISFKGAKTPEQMMQKIQEALVAADEEVAKFALGTDKYNKLNETSRNALNRLSSSLSLVNDMFKDLGFALKDIGLEGADAASKLVDALGGASAAQSKLAFVYDKFYTEEQKQANILNRTTAALTKLNLELPTSRNAYLALLDTATKLGDPKTFASLVDLAPAIDALYPAIEPVVESMSLLADYMELTGDKAGALALRRSEELKKLNALDAATQRRIYALQDEKDAYDAARTALASTRDGLKATIKSLTDFQTGVLSGSSGLATPEQQFAAQKQLFEQAIARAKGPLDTQANRDLAAQGAQDALKYAGELQASAKTLYASGAGAKSVQDYILQQTGGLTDVLSLSKTGVEAQIASLDSTTNGLVTLEGTLTVTNTLLNAYNLANAETIKLLYPATHKTIMPVVPDQRALSAPVNTQQALVDTLTENNKLLQKQLDDARTATAAIIASNALAVQAQTNQLEQALTTTNTTPSSGTVEYSGNLYNEGGGGRRSGQTTYALD